MSDPFAYALMAYGRLDRVVKREDVADEIVRKLREQGAPVGVIPLHTDAELSALRAQLAEVTAEIALLRTALRFYARSEHYHCDPDEQFDTVSGEPQNWLFSGLEDSGTMIEDGSIARQALRCEPTNYIDGDEDTTPQPIDGEVSCIDAARSKPATEHNGSPA